MVNLKAARLEKLSDWHRHIASKSSDSDHGGLLVLDKLVPPKGGFQVRLLYVTE
jgi:hypothetical protein